MIFITIDPVASPTVSECSQLKPYASSLVTRLQGILDLLNASSSNPDEAMVLIREKVAQMIKDAEAVKSNISKISSGAATFANNHPNSVDGMLNTGRLNNGPPEGMA